MGKRAAKSFVYGAFVIAAANVMIKLIGALFKIPLDSLILKPEGMGIYNAAYTIYNWLFVIATAGLPVAISKMVAESTAQGNHADAKKIFRISFKLLCVIGLIGFVVMFFGARWFSNAVSQSRAVYTMLVLSPSLFFVAVMSSFRGYFQGMQNMYPTAISEVIEALCKLIIGLSMASYLLPKGLEYASAGAISGVTVGSVLGTVFLVIYYYHYKRHAEFHNYGETSIKSSRKILKRLIKIAIPITIGVSVFTLTSVIDMAMVMNQLKGLGYDESARSTMYGYLGRAITLFNLPPTVISAIAISVVPSIAAALAVKNRKLAQSTTKSALRLTIIFSLPCALGLFTLAQPILQAVYRDGSYYFLLMVMGLAVALVTIVQVGNAILQSCGKVWVPVFNMLVGGVVKVVANLILVSQPAININGAPIGTFLCYFTVMALNLRAIKRYTGVKYEIMDFLIKPLFSAIVMGIAAYAVYGFVFRAVISNLLALACAILAGGIVYVVCLLLCRGLKEEDVYLIPVVKKFAPVLKKMKLI